MKATTATDEIINESLTAARDGEDCEMREKMGEEDERKVCERESACESACTSDESVCVCVCVCERERERERAIHLQASSSLFDEEMSE